MKKPAAVILLAFILILATGARANWEKQSTGSLAWFKTVHFVDAETGWIGGSQGTVLKTSDGGRNWKKHSGITSDTVKKIFFTDRSSGWMLCERDIYSLGTAAPSYLLRTTDGGTNWKRIEFRDSNRRRITDLVFDDHGGGFAVGEMGMLYGLSGDGEWEKLRSPTSHLILGVAMAGTHSGAIAGGGGTILFTEDGGETWDSASVSGKTKTAHKSVFFIDEKKGWIVGSKGSVFQTINGGKYWLQQKAGTDVDLNGVFFRDGMNGWAVGDMGTILVTNSGGNTWSKSELRSRNHLEDIHFTGNMGWIVGFGGTLLRYKVDPSE